MSWSVQLVQATTDLITWAWSTPVHHEIRKTMSGGSRAEEDIKQIMSYILRTCVRQMFSSNLDVA